MNQAVLDAVQAATEQCQRWKGRRVGYRPPNGYFNPSRIDVVPLPTAEAKAFVETHHYSKSFPASRFCVGIVAKPSFGSDYLGGVIVYSVPMSQRVVPAVLPGLLPNQGIELGRMVLLDTPELMANVESYSIARANRLLRMKFPELRGMVAYCDPYERRDAMGQVVKRSHTGVVYRAVGCSPMGLSAPRTLWLMPDGNVASERALSKLRSGDCGRDYAAEMLLSRGASPMLEAESPTEWVQRLKLTGFLRPLRHTGNVRFAWDWGG